MLARRTEGADRHSRSEVMMRIATITVCVGMMAMIITLSVFNGFRKQIYSDFRGFGSDLTLFDVSGLNDGEAMSYISYSEELLHSIKALERVERAAPYLTIGAMAKQADQLLGLQVKAIDKQYLLNEYDVFDHNYCIVEVFRYDPKLLSGSQYIDVISLYAQFKDHKDERVQIEIESLVRTLRPPQGR